MNNMFKADFVVIYLIAFPISVMKWNESHIKFDDRPLGLLNGTWMSYLKIISSRDSHGYYECM